MCRTNYILSRVVLRDYIRPGYYSGWRFGLVVTLLGLSTKLLYVEPG